MTTPTELIKRIRDSFVGAEKIYMHGSCLQFYWILKAVFPDAVPVWSKRQRHLYTRIGRTYFDIRGKVRKPKDGEIVYDVGLVSWATVTDFITEQSVLPKKKIIYRP